MNYLKKAVLLGLLALACAQGYGQGVGISATNAAPDSSAILDVSSTTQGMLVPRMRTGQRDSIANPATGLLVFDNDFGSFWFYDGSGWVNLSAGDSPITVENSNIFAGDSAGARIGTGKNNVAIGSEAGKSLTNISANIAIGTNALAALDGSGNGFNVAIGWNTSPKTKFAFNTGGTSVSPFEGFGNAAVGARTLEQNVSGALLTASGYQAMQRNTTGSDNSAFGAFTLNKNTTGLKNSALGFRSLQENTTGNQNTAIGFDAGFGGRENENCTYVGAFARNDSDISSYTNSTALGYQATITADNQVRIGNADVTSIGGQVAWSTLSDGRFKTNVRENVPGLSFIMQLRPVTYQVDKAKLKAKYNNASGDGQKTQSGLIAQEVEQAAKAVDFDFDGVTPAQNPEDHYTLSYAKMVVPLIKAVQELRQVVAKQGQHIGQLSAEVTRLRGEAAPSTGPVLPTVSK